MPTRFQDYPTFAMAVASATSAAAIRALTAACDREDWCAEAVAYRARHFDVALVRETVRRGQEGALIANACLPDTHVPVVIECILRRLDLAATDNGRLGSLDVLIEIAARRRALHLSAHTLQVLYRVIERQRRSEVRDALTAYHVLADVMEEARLMNAGPAAMSRAVVAFIADRDRRREPDRADEWDLAGRELARHPLLTPELARMLLAEHDTVALRAALCRARGDVMLDAFQQDDLRAILRSAMTTDPQAAFTLLLSPRADDVAEAFAALEGLWRSPESAYQALANPRITESMLAHLPITVLERLLEGPDEDLRFKAFGTIPHLRPPTDESPAPAAYAAAADRVRPRGVRR